MKPIFFALTALGGLAAASPALAQTYPYGYQGNNDRYYNNYTNRGGTYYDDDRAYANVSVDTRIARLEQSLNAGIRAGSIDRDEAMRLRAELRDLRRMSRQYGYGGVNSAERSDLMARLRTVQEDLRSAEGGSGYGYNDGYNNGYGSSSTYGSGYGSSTYGNGTYGSSTYGNGYGGSSSYSSSNNGYYGRGGPYENSDGYSSGYGTLRVGDAVTGSLYGVPTELRGTYRDGYNYYYRSDGRAIYQIDARSNTVLRIYPLNR